MPEGDTVHRAAGRLRAMLAGHVPDEIVTPHPRHGPQRWPERLRGQAVRSVDAYGKHLFIRFEGGLTLHSHLRMTGLWSVLPAGGRWRRAPRRAWLVLRSAGMEAVEFDGPVLDLVPDVRLRADPRLRALGPDILGESFDERRFLARLRGEGGRAIGDALLDQRVVAGLGNVWKSESCFAAAVDPWAPASAVDDDRALSVVRFARGHMRTAVERGHIARPRAVYDRAGRPCLRCGAIVRSRGQGDNNRLTYWCPGCQA